jgi:hypothetical protein
MATKRRSFNMEGLSELLAYLFFPVQRTGPFASILKIHNTVHRWK